MLHKSFDYLLTLIPFCKFNRTDWNCTNIWNEMLTRYVCIGTVYMYVIYYWPCYECVLTYMGASFVCTLSCRYPKLALGGVVNLFSDNRFLLSPGCLVIWSQNSGSSFNRCVLVRTVMNALCTLQISFDQGYYYSRPIEMKRIDK